MSEVAADADEEPKGPSQRCRVLPSPLRCNRNNNMRLDRMP